MSLIRTQYGLIQHRRVLTTISERETAISHAKSMAKETKYEVEIEERRITMIVRPDGTTIVNPESK